MLYVFLNVDQMPVTKEDDPELGAVKKYLTQRQEDGRSLPVAADPKRDPDLFDVLARMGQAKRRRPFMRVAVMGRD